MGNFSSNVNKQVRKEIEARLYGYHRNLAEIESLKFKAQRMQSVHGQVLDVIAGDKSSGYSDPVAARMEKLSEIEARIIELESLTRPITRLIQDLKEYPSVIHSDYLGLITNKFFSHNSKIDVMDTLSLTEATYRRVYCQVINMTARYCGL